MKILYLIFVALATFGLTLIGKPKIKYSILFCLAIGGAVNANYFNASDYPIYCFGMPFGVDAVIYMLFIFCVVVTYRFYNFKSVLALLLSSVAAILFAAVIQLIAEISSQGYATSSLFTFGDFCMSAISTVVAVFAMLYLMRFLDSKKVNDYLVVFLGLLVGAVLNSALYYGLSALLNGVQADFLSYFVPSVIAKVFSLCCSMGTYALLKLQQRKQAQTDITSAYNQ